MASAEREQLVRFKKKIDRFLKGSDKEDVASMKDVLNNVKETAVTLKDLETTEIGIAVNKLRKDSTDDDIKVLAKFIMKSWKRLAEGKSPRSLKKSASGDGKPLTPSASTPRASTPRAGPNEGVPAMSDVLTGHLPDSRQRSAKGLFGIIYKVWHAEARIDKKKVPLEKVQTLSVSMEAAINSNFPDSRDYASKLRSMAANLGKNFELFCELLHDIVTVEELVNMKPEQLASQAMQDALEQEKKDILDERRSDYQDANQDKINASLGISKTGMFYCGKCKSENTTFFQMQTRSSDEPMTSFIRCIDCGNRWKE